MEAYIEILNFSAITLLVLIGVLFIKKGKSKQHVLPCAIFCFTVASYLFKDWEHLHFWVYLLLHIPIFSVSFCFWIFSKSIFDDNFKFKKWMAWLIIFIIVILFANFYYREQLDRTSIAYKVSILIHHIPTITFTFLAIIEAAKNKEADLLIDRLQFRNVFIITTGIVITSVVFVEISFPDGIPLLINLIQKFVIVALAFYFALKQLNIDAGFFNAPALVVEEQPKPVLDTKLIKQLTQLIEGEKYYRTEGLTIGLLAEKIKVKEYKLRQTINQQMGFRNFNDFLNSYRIQEACDHLRDPNKNEHTILEIAYDMGYHSLAPFNKAFKNITGMTPTEYRQLKGL